MPNVPAEIRYDQPVSEASSASLAAPGSSWTHGKWSPPIGTTVIVAVTVASTFAFLAFGSLALASSPWKPPSTSQREAIKKATIRWANTATAYREGTYTVRVPRVMKGRPWASIQLKRRPGHPEVQAVVGLAHRSAGRWRVVNGQFISYYRGAQACVGISVQVFKALNVPALSSEGRTSRTRPVLSGLRFVLIGAALLLASASPADASTSSCGTLVFARNTGDVLQSVRATRISCSHARSVLRSWHDAGFRPRGHPKGWTCRAVGGQPAGGGGRVRCMKRSAVISFGSGS